MHGAAEAERLLQLPLLEFASSKRVRDGNRSRKQERAKNPKDDEKRKRGETRRGISESRL